MTEARDKAAKRRAGGSVKCQVVVGKCPVCGAVTESADKDGLKGLLCARGHEPTPYEPQDAYYEDEAKTWVEE